MRISLAVLSTIAGVATRVAIADPLDPEHQSAMLTSGAPAVK